MPKFTTFGSSRLTRGQRYTTAGLAVSAAALTLTAIPGPAGNDTATIESVRQSASVPAPFEVKVDDVQGQTSGPQKQPETAPEGSAAAAGTAEQKGEDKKDVFAQKTDKNNENQKSPFTNEKTAAEKMAEAKQKYADKHADRTDNRKSAYADNLDGWIRESLAIMKEKGIPGTYEGIHRNVMRESSGDPRAINNWDINARNGVPSKGLLQVIQPTFETYHVEGTAWDQYDPVANITAATNYAADRYGTIDNVDSAY